MLSEFSLIDRYFARRASPPSSRHDNAAAMPLGIGDDCALIAPPAGHQLAISTDMLVEGRHFFPDVDPNALGHKALAVNLSDLAAMGAKPHAFTLALALPRADEAWLAAFSDGLFALAQRFDCALIGGDTTSGPLNICITVFGDVPHGAALRRDAAKPDDDIYVSGTLGDARAGLGAIRGEWPAASSAWNVALERPEPRVALGLALRGVAHAALDISDGLAGDLMHILRRSNVRAIVDADAVPCSDAVRALPEAARRQCALAGGDDYELCFTAPRERRDAVARIAERVGVALTRIGTIEAMSAPCTTSTPAIDWRDNTGAPLSLTLQGFDHFHAD
ncbi:thiamine-phosphate kinase [Caballeronia sp. LP006]|uniref:thiamine-phosphate kinase n=1 Tax=unclassified Caballeronia TaxID=2646786 RepID=UPI002027980D|nr:MULTISPECIES: thiamine-phosphate kinase [unclassified Caballeronia]MDR5772524.1 thiamine-phosphate kinase [Caballeronia sp. LZ002]MDR5804048.1 thiamine-phosphate kinase [Caballeronia sp. LZ001]MDR5832117.1 thiamine-phosphate kinase [Caballeronia sp. LP006]MDR5847958.1 thiamine-phosphate kinase [Caballeronia sp. LZ003]